MSEKTKAVETEEVVELTEIQKAQQLIEQEKAERANAFAYELDQLCKKYRCSLHVGQITINVE